MQPHQFLHEGQADARAFVRAGARVGDAVEALEEVRQLVCRDARPGVAHPKRHVIPTPGQADSDLAREGKLEGVREQVEDDLLPHVAIHVDGFGNGGHSTTRPSPARSMAERKTLARSAVTVARSVDS